MFVLKRLFFIVLIAVTSGLNAQGLTAEQILKKSEAKLRGGSQVFSEIKVNIQRKNWSRTMFLKTWTKGAEYSMILVTAPERDSGTVFLKQQDKVYSYIPKFRRITKLPPAALAQNFMGTDLTNEDLVKDNDKMQDFKFTLKNDTVVDGLLCYNVELEPKEGANVLWSKMNLFIDQQDFITLRNEMYDEDGELMNLLKASKIKILNGNKIPTFLEMIPVQKKGQKTTVEILSIDTKVDLQTTFFSKDNMKLVR